MPFILPRDNNLLTVSWATGSGSTGMFNQNGTTDENERVNDTNPFGSTDVVWETRPTTNAGGADGGWNTDWFNIDRTKTYRFSVWARRTTSSSSGTNYLGMYDNGTVQEIKDDSTEGNPYWDCRNIGWMTQNTWYLIVGHVFPTGHLGKVNHPDTGYYTVAGGVSGRSNIGFCNIGGDLKWSSTATQAIHRCYHFYASNDGSKTQLYAPRVDLCDGSEPSIDDLLNNRLNLTLNANTSTSAGASRIKRVLDGSSIQKAAPDAIFLYKNGQRTNGMYWLNPGGLGANLFYIDFTYRTGVPLTLVISNRRGNGGQGSNASYARCTGPWVNHASGTYDANLNFNVMVGLDYWRYLGDTVVQCVKGYQASYSAGTHNTTIANMDRIAKWKYAGFNSTYGFKYARDYSDVSSSGVTTGMYSYHAVNEYSFTTYDNDQDAYGGNCSTSYGNAGWWFGACWDGNAWGNPTGSGHVDAYYWSSSTNDYFAYGAVYLGFWDSTVD